MFYQLYKFYHESELYFTIFFNSIENLSPKLAQGQLWITLLVSILNDDIRISQTKKIFGTNRNKFLSCLDLSPKVFKSLIERKTKIIWY